MVPPSYVCWFIFPRNEGDIVYLPEVLLTYVFFTNLYLNFGWISSINSWNFKEHDDFSPVDTSTKTANYFTGYIYIYIYIYTYYTSIPCQQTCFGSSNKQCPSDSRMDRFNYKRNIHRKPWIFPMRYRDAFELFYRN